MTNIWNEFCRTENDGFNAVFRLTIAVIMIPHCYLEWMNLPDMIRFNEENMVPVSNVLLYFTGLVMILEGISVLFVSIGMFGAVSARILSTCICLHFLSSEDIVFSLFWNYRIYVLLVPILSYVALRGSGRFSIDRWLCNSKRTDRISVNPNNTIL